MSKELIRLRDLCMAFDDEPVLNKINLYINDKEFLTLLGPSGCGKTTTLRIIGGFTTPTSGDVLFDGVRINDVPPYQRQINTVFQKYALFPHLNVYENIAFGLRMQRRPDPNDPTGKRKVKIPEQEIHERVMEMLEVISLKGFEHRKPDALSGKGSIQQIGTPEDIYNEPKNAFVADFIGESNIIDGIMVRDNLVQMYGKQFPCLDGGFGENEPVDVVIRPEDIDIVPVEQGQLTGTVTNVTFMGMQYDIIVDFRGFKWLIQTTDHSPVGARIGIKLDPDAIHVMKKSQYSGMFGDYSSFSEEYDELDDASALDEEESGDAE